MNRSYSGDVYSSGYLGAADGATLLRCTTRRFNRIAAATGLRSFQITKKTRLYAFADVIAFAVRVRLGSKRGYEKRPDVLLNRAKTERLGNAKRAIIERWELQQKTQLQLVMELSAIKRGRVK